MNGTQYALMQSVISFCLPYEQNHRAVTWIRKKLGLFHHNVITSINIRIMVPIQLPYATIKQKILQYLENQLKLNCPEFSSEQKITREKRK